MTILSRRSHGRSPGGATIVLLTTGASLVIRILSSITLTRLLTPDAFGLVGIITSIFFAITMVTDLGIQSYLMRHADGDDPRFRDVLWTIHLGRSALLCLVAMAASPVVATLLEKPELEWPLMAASTTLFLAGLVSLAPMTEVRAGRIGRLSAVDLALNILQTIAAVLLAIWLRSVWAIIIASILYGALRVVCSYAIFPGSIRRLAFDRNRSRDLFRFSRIVLLSSSLTLAIAQADKFALARALTLRDFGFYAIAGNLAAVPIGFLTVYVSRVLYPAYARSWNEDAAQLPLIYYAVRRHVSLFYALGTGAMVGGAGLLVLMLYDPRYVAVGPYLSLLAIGCALRLPNLAATEAMTAIGQVQTTLYANVVRLVWLLGAGAAGYLQFGAIGLVAAVGLIEVPAMAYCWIALRRATILKIRSELAYLAVVLAGAAIAYGVSLLLNRIW